MKILTTLILMCIILVFPKELTWSKTNTNINTTAIINNKFNLFKLNITFYTAVGNQVIYDTVYTSSHYHGEYGGFSPRNATNLKWVAVSQDLLWYNGGPLKYGDKIIIHDANKLSGIYTVKDCMASYMKNSIDILLSIKDKNKNPTGRWKSNISILKREFIIK